MARPIALALALGVATLTGLAQAAPDSAAPAPAAAAAPATVPPLWSAAALIAPPASPAAAGDAERRAALGILYAVPAYLHLRQRHALLGYLSRDGGNPYGRFMLLRQPAGPEVRDPSPNHDTLYGAAFLDLAAGPVVLSVPAVPARYYSVALLDAYFNNFAYVGSRTTGQAAGDYLIVGPGWKGEVPAGMAGVIRAPTNSINLYQRIYFKDAADLPAVHALQDAFRLKPLALDPAVRPAVPDPAPVFAHNPQTARDAADMLAHANRYMADNPPPAADRALLAQFADLGIGPGAQVPGDAAGRAVLAAGEQLARQALQELDRKGGRTVNGWQIPAGDVGRRGASGGPVTQALTQIRTIGINVPEEAVYYTSSVDASGAPLRADRRYRLHFAPGQLPPVDMARHGFWSLTMMHRENYRLVANPANKYAVRSGDALVRGPDGGLTLYLQTEPPADPALLANWLPAPATGEFTLNLRVYLGEPDVVTGRWAPPAITPVN